MNSSPTFRFDRAIIQLSPFMQILVKASRRAERWNLKLDENWLERFYCILCDTNLLWNEASTRRRALDGKKRFRVPSRHFHFSHTKSLEMFTRLFHIWTSIDRNSSRRCIVESTLKSQREKWFRPEPDFIFHFGDYARMESHLPSRNKGAGSGKRLFLPLTEHHANGASRMSALESVKSFLRSKRKDFSPNFT